MAQKTWMDYIKEAIVKKTVENIVAIVGSASAISVAALTAISSRPWQELVLAVSTLLLGLATILLWYRTFKRDWLVTRSGITSVSMHEEHERSKNWVSCVEQINREVPATICILGATGWETFGKNTSPLNETVEKYSGELNILLMDPRPEINPALRQRALDLKMNEHDYVDQINRTLTKCRDLKKSGKKIRVKVYTQMPIWKMVIAPNYFLWLQHYRKNSHVEATPVYMLYADKDQKTSLYWPLYQVFEKRWYSDGNSEVDLSKPEFSTL